MVVLAVIVALGYFALAFVVLPRIELVEATPGFRKAFRLGGVGFFAGCGLTHTHIAVHAAGNGNLVAPHEVAFHLVQAVGVWVFVYVALKFIDVRVERRRTPAQVLESQVAELSRSNEDLEQFARVVSHDLQGPLRTAGGFAELLERKEADALSDRGRQYVEHLRSSHQQMQDLLDGILRYSRAAGEGLERTEVDLNDTVEEVRQALAGQLAEAGATLEVDDLPTVSGDLLQLRQVLLNLVANALKFHGDAPPRIEIGAEPGEGTWTVSVRDHGIGLDPADAEQIFEMFGRGSGVEGTAGSGIGLAVCRKIVARHGGELTAAPAEGGGAVFRMTLPALATPTLTVRMERRPVGV